MGAHRLELRHDGDVRLPGARPRGFYGRAEARNPRADYQDVMADAVQPTILLPDGDSEEPLNFVGAETILLESEHPLRN
jgi:hypothetical protein